MKVCTVQRNAYVCTIQFCFDRMSVLCSIGSAFSPLLLFWPLYWSWYANRKAVQSVRCSRNDKTNERNHCD